MNAINIGDNPVIYQEGRFRINVTSLPAPGAIELLQLTCYGTSGIRYQQTGQTEKLADIGKAIYFHLYDESRLVGFFCLDPRDITFLGAHIDGYYGRYFAIAPEYQGLSLGSRLIEEVTRFIRTRIHGPSMIYVYVESRNTRSVNCFTNNGYRQVSHCKTFVFRRMFPRRVYQVVSCADDQLDEVRESIADACRGAQFLTTKRIGYRENYFLCFDQDRLVGGLQANPVTWRFQSMPGISGRMMMHLLPLVPIANRLFQPEYQFLAVDSVHLLQGQKAEVPAMLESVLAYTGAYSMILQSDTTFRRTLDGNDAGAISGYQHGVSTGIYCLPIHFPDGDWVFDDSECFISSFDFT